ncbi:hypothetical protein, partial [Cereibacter changlensis]|uniref:hypothetical protein n=1 Tax=Cereibacter changlensis TaxID=402884 RepID=UPI001B801D51
KFGRSARGVDFRSGYALPSVDAPRASLILIVAQFSSCLSRRTSTISTAKDLTTTIKPKAPTSMGKTTAYGSRPNRRTRDRSVAAARNGVPGVPGSGRP